MLILIDLFGEPGVVTNEDGEILYFDDAESATEYAEKELQGNYRIVDVSEEGVK
jgi:hypothetical protein